ncbi:hypothetical protein R70211_06330 [Paraburkholderia domus]|uniref:Uncharacterized protein n=1 Tax=Paraburkholderia domus TaxID=2793075 RepID=A0A9N8N4P5_9BURK|nr:hypothetical protein R70211_06330 [Paraburkholderia domus]
MRLRPFSNVLNVRVASASRGSQKCSSSALRATAPSTSRPRIDSMKITTRPSGETAVSDPAKTRTASFLRSLPGSSAAAPDDRLMHAPRLKKWAAIIDHRDFIRRRACDPQLNHAEICRALVPASIPPPNGQKCGTPAVSRGPDRRGHDAGTPPPERNTRCEDAMLRQIVTHCLPSNARICCCF